MSLEHDFGCSIFVKHPFSMLVSNHAPWFTIVALAQVALRKNGGNEHTHMYYEQK